MANANKNKGDRAEMAVRDYAYSRHEGSFRTRAGFNDDLGDVIVDHPAGRLVLQVKDVASPNWKKWREQLDQQVGHCEAASDVDVLGGVIVHKYRGHADPATWHAVTDLDSLITLLDDAYNRGKYHGMLEGL